MRRLPLLLLIAFVIIFIAWRLVFLGWSEYVYDEEEAKTGSISVILMQGPSLPLMEHQPGDYEGGTLLFGILAIPFMWIFGKPYLGLKLMALATSLVLALFSTLWIRKLAGLPGVVFSGLLWLFAVPYVVQVCFIPWGNYAETAMLSAITFYLVHSLAFEGRHEWWRFILLGFLFGLGTWMHYGYLITVFVCLVFIFIADIRIIFSRKAVAAFISGIVGFSPWLVYNFTHHFWGLGRFADGLASPSAGGKIGRVVGRIWTLFSQDIPASYHLIIGGMTFTKIISYLFYIIFIGLFAVLIWLNRDGIKAALASSRPRNQNKARRNLMPALVPAAYFLAYGFIFSFSEYGIFLSRWGAWEPESHVHIFVMLPAMIWIASASAAMLWDKAKAVSIILVGVLSVIGLIGQLSMLDFSKDQGWRLASDFSGEKKVIYMEIGSKWGRAHHELDKIASKLDGIDLESLYFGAGITYGLDHVQSLQVALDKCAALEDRYLPYCHFGIGTGLFSSGTLDVAAFDDLISKAPEPTRPYLLAGGAVGAIWFGKIDHPYLEKAAAIDFAAIAPPERKKQLPSFIQGHLDMIKFRPKKE